MLKGAPLCLKDGNAAENDWECKNPKVKNRIKKNNIFSHDNLFFSKINNLY